MCDLSIDKYVSSHECMNGQHYTSRTLGKMWLFHIIKWNRVHLCNVWDSGYKYLTWTVVLARVKITLKQNPSFSRRGTWLLCENSCCWGIGKEVGDTMGIIGVSIVALEVVVEGTR